jgi:hypothetical protein
MYNQYSMINEKVRLITGTWNLKLEIFCVSIYQSEMIKNRNGPLTARARSDPSLLIGRRGDPMMLFCARGDPPVKHNARDRFQERFNLKTLKDRFLSLSKDGLKINALASRYMLDGRGMPGWEAPFPTSCLSAGNSKGESFSFEGEISLKREANNY